MTALNLAWALVQLAFWLAVLGMFLALIAAAILAPPLAVLSLAFPRARRWWARGA